MALIFSYGDYEFNPKPLFTIGKEYIKTPSNMGLGTRYVVTLEGQIIPSTGKIPSGDPQAGLQDVFTATDAIQRAFDNDFKLLHLYCDDGSDPIISGYPRVTSFEVSNAGDNYVVRSNYSITLELPSLKGTSFDSVGPVSSGVSSSCGADGLDISASGLISYSDDFTVEFLDERVGGELSLGLGVVPSIFSVQRNISAQGDSQASCAAYKEPWELANDFVKLKLGFPSELATLSGLLCPADQVSNNFRSVNVNKTDGSVTVNETYIAMTGSERAYEDFEVNVSQAQEDPYVTITIDGTINGLAEVVYSSGCPATGEPKFNHAIDYWQDKVSGVLFSRATAVYDATPKQSGHPTPATLNRNTLNESIGYNPIAGSINYSYTYNNRPVHCYHHALTEEITFSEGEPQDVFASITILGKVSGPLLQSIGTVGQRTRELSINALLPPVNDCASVLFNNAPDVYDALVLNYAAVLNAAYTQVFVTNSAKTWEPKTGRFSLQQSWTVGSC